METIIVEICLAATGRVVDFMLPAHVTLEAMMGSLVSLVEQAFQELTYQGGRPMLCDLTTGNVIAPSFTLAQAGVRDGHRLLLV